MLKSLATVFILAAATVYPAYGSVMNPDDAAINSGPESWSRDSRLNSGSAGLATSLATSDPCGDTQEVREDFQQTYPLTANGRVILENLNGGVRIRVWDRNEVQVTAQKRAFNRERLAEALNACCSL